ncbi:MAG: hypothetical protein BA869_09695 [Desulfuromonadales bacterium C00003107]|nr:MAG: hypothetical protein BA869_09695 [Desulfuromonadales bacterium C00003107]
MQEPKAALALVEVTRQDITEVLDRSRDRGALTAAHATFRILRPLFAFGVGNGMHGIENSVCFMMKVRGKPGACRRYLSPAEIKDLWEALDHSGRMHWSTAASLKLLLLTGQRCEQVAEMPLDEIKGEWWCLPPERTKIAVPQRMYLVPMALEVLRLDEPRKWAFPQKKNPAKSIAYNTMTQAARRLSDGEDTTFDKKRWEHPPFTPRDLRRTVSTHMQELGIDDRIIDAVQHHVAKGVRDNYNQYRFDREKREAILLWEARLKDILASEYDAEGRAISGPLAEEEAIGLPT